MRAIHELKMDPQYCKFSVQRTLRKDHQIIVLLFLLTLVLFLNKATAVCVYLLQYTGTGKNEDKYTFAVSLNVMTKFFSCIRRQNHQKWLKDNLKILFPLDILTVFWNVRYITSLVLKKVGVTDVWK